MIFLSHFLLLSLNKGAAEGKPGTIQAICGEMRSLTVQSRLMQGMPTARKKEEGIWKQA